MLIRILISLYISSILFYFLSYAILTIKTHKYLLSLGYKKNNEDMTTITSLIRSIFVTIIISIIPFLNVIVGYGFIMHETLIHENAIIKVEYGLYIKDNT